MKLDFQAKFLQHLNKKRKTDEGFTLIELLVVIIIIGILAAIALPSLLGQVNKAKQSEAKNNIGAMNRAQQATYLEYSEFTTDLAVLGIAISTTSSNYSYTVVMDGTSNLVNNIANSLPKAKTLKSYVGIVGTVQGSTSTSELLSQAAACESTQVGAGGHVSITPGTPPIGSPSCPSGSHRSLSGK